MAAKKSKIPFRLYVFTQSGCGACEFAKPHIAKFRRAHPEGLVLEVPATKKVLGFKATGTPAYLLAIEDEHILDFTGALTASQMEMFLKDGIKQAEKDGVFGDAEGDEGEIDVEDGYEDEYDDFDEEDEEDDD